MENIIGWALMILIPAFIVGLVVYSRMTYKRYKIKREEEERLAFEAKIEAKRKDAEYWKNRTKGATHVGRTKYDFNTNTHTTTVTNTATNNRVSYVHMKDDGPDILTTLIVADLLSSNKDSSSGSVSWNNDVPSIDSTSYSDTSSSSSDW